MLGGERCLGRREREERRRHAPGKGREHAPPPQLLTVTRPAFQLCTRLLPDVLPWAKSLLSQARSCGRPRCYSQACFSRSPSPLSTRVLLASPHTVPRTSDSGGGRDQRRRTWSSECLPESAARVVTTTRGKGEDQEEPCNVP